MKKAYDPKELINEMKKEGLPVLEEMAEGATKALFRWLNESADISENPYDNMAKVVYPMIEKQALSFCDKIDGQEG